jgi:hypothetical protein
MVTTLIFGSLIPGSEDVSTFLLTNRIFSINIATRLVAVFRGGFRCNRCGKV